MMMWTFDDNLGICAVNLQIFLELVHGDFMITSVNSL